MKSNLKKGGANDGSRVEVVKGLYGSDGKLSAYLDLSTTLRIRVGSNGPSSSILLGDHVLFEGEMMEDVMAILGCSYPELAEMIKALCPKEEAQNE